MFEETSNSRPDQSLQHRISKMQRVAVDEKNSFDSPQRIVLTAVVKNYPQISHEEAHHVAKELVLQPRDTKVAVGGEDVRVEDLQFKIAGSIELINSETNSTQEYFRWIDEAPHIIAHMNDGFVSAHDLSERNDFLQNLDQREAELMVCLGLYEKSQYPLANDKYKELANKLYKLREIRSAVNHSTKDIADREVSKMEYENALKYYHAVKKIEKLAPEEKRDLGIYHDDDFKGLSFNDKLKYEMSWGHAISHGALESVLMSHDEEQTKETIAMKIERLRGRITPTEKVHVNAYIENIKKRRFDMNHYNELSRTA